MVHDQSISRTSNNSSTLSASSTSSMLLRSHCRANQHHDHVCNHYSVWATLIAVFLFSAFQLVILEKYYFSPKLAKYTENAHNLSLQLKRLKEQQDMEESLNLQRQYQNNYYHHSLSQRASGILSSTQHSESKDKGSCISFEEARQLIKAELNLYDADKTFMADYALESSGATIVATRCTKNYAENNIKYSINGLVPVMFTSNSPRVVIQPTVVPGDCWSFAGSEGNMVVQLSRTIIPTAFTYEHIRKELSPDLNIDSAPKHFKVRSLRDVHDTEGLLLGEYYFDKNSDPLQQFQVQNPNPMPTRFIELIILSNNGEMQYTCLYRFRVHGQRYD